MIPEDVDDATATALLVSMFDELDGWLIEHRRTNVAVAGSRHAVDDAAADPFYVSFAAHQALTHALDHLRALRAIVVRAQELPLAAGFTLLRGTLENACTAVWLLAPVDRSERVLRRMHLVKHDLEDVAQVEALGIGRNGPDRSVFVAKMQEIGLAAGVDMQRLAGRQPSLSRIVREAGAATAAGAVRVEATWRLCSGFSHGRSWSAASALHSRDVRELAPGVWDVEMRAPVQAVAAVAQTTQRVLAEALRLHVRYRNFPG